MTQSVAAYAVAQWSSACLVCGRPWILPSTWQRQTLAHSMSGVPRSMGRSKAGDCWGSTCSSPFSSQARNLFREWWAPQLDSQASAELLTERFSNLSLVALTIFQLCSLVVNTHAILVTKGTWDKFLVLPGKSYHYEQACQGPATNIFLKGGGY